jgi:hypothetical protein
MAGASCSSIGATISNNGEKPLQIEESIQMGDAPYQLLWKASAVKK